VRNAHFPKDLFPTRPYMTVSRRVAPWNEHVYFSI
jgi:hypothetical protein